MTIQDDLSILNTAESGNQDLFSKLYQDFETPDFSPSGKLNIYIKIPYAFPSVVRINGLGAAERESFIDKLYFYLLDQANGDYNTIAHPQSDSSKIGRAHV